MWRGCAVFIQSELKHVPTLHLSSSLTASLSILVQGRPSLRNTLASHQERITNTKWGFGRHRHIVVVLITTVMLIQAAPVLHASHSWIQPCGMADRGLQHADETLEPVEVSGHTWCVHSWSGHRAEAAGDRWTMITVVSSRHTSPGNPETAASTTEIWARHTMQPEGNLQLCLLSRDAESLCSLLFH